jgi:hypothetical protein
MGTNEVTFATARSVGVNNGELTPIPLPSPHGSSDHVDYQGQGVVFRTDGLYEVLLKVDWEPSARRGTRFSHTNIPDQEPLHSEAIAADVLADISGGSQRLRAMSLFGPDRTKSLVLEVWQDSGQAVTINAASLTVREIEVPWCGEAARR